MNNKIFLDNLPRCKGGIGNGHGRKGTINWKESIGCKIKFIYEDIIGEVEVIDYEMKKSRIIIKYLKEIFNIKTGHFMNCHLGNITKIITKDFKIEIGTIFKDRKRNLIITNREYRPIQTKEGIINHKHYKYTCNKCGWTEGWIVEYNLLKGIGCSCCGVNSKTVVEGINDIPTTDPWMIKYFQGGYNEAKLYTRSCSKKIRPICSDCGRIKDNEISIHGIYTNKSIGCRCGDGFSYPEKIMINVLEQLNIDFATRKVINNKIYDFYIPFINTIIETHGGQHYKENGFIYLNGKSLKEEQKNDLYKKQLANEKINVNNYIVINCKKSDLEYIKINILNSDLVKIFNMDNIDWLKCEEFALTNLVKKVCEYKKDKPELTVIEISSLVNLSDNTIRRYLKQGSKLGWCNYNPKERNKQSRDKKVKIFKDDIALGEFRSIAELVKQSEQLFGVKLSASKISDVCNNKKQTHKGYTFKFI